MKNNILIYRHVRLDTSQVFYIGIGNEKRPYSKHRRNRFWKNIVNKTKYEIQVLKFNLTWEEAVELEIILISYYGRKDIKTGILCNMTGGGEGSYGRKQTQNCKDKISKANKGKIGFNKGKTFTKEHCEKISNSKKGKRILGNSKKVIDKNTGLIYESLIDVSNIFNIKYSTLAGYLNKNIKTNITSFEYIENYTVGFDKITNNIKITDHYNYCNLLKKWIVTYNSEIIAKFKTEKEAVRIAKHVQDEILNQK
jgi:hypothetical protein